MKELKRILLAEDDPNDIELSLEALKEHNLANEVIVVNDGEEAWDYLKKLGEYKDLPPGLPAVILLDIKMPKLNGLDLLRQIKKDSDLKNIPVIMLTSSREEPDLKLAYQLGANAYVVKPVNFHEFIDAVKSLGMFWAVLNEPPPESLKKPSASN